MHKVRDQKILNQFSERLKEVRKSKGFTQEKLSDESGITLSQIARIETGKLNSSLCTIVTLSKAMNVSPSELLKFKE